MHKTFIDDFVHRVFRFNKEVVGVQTNGVKTLSDGEASWLHSALLEEAEELLMSQSAVEQVDACVDAAVFAIGGLARLGLTSHQAVRCLHAVMDANFEKRPGVKEGRAGAKDAIKPEGWVGPEDRIAEILYREGQQKELDV